MEDATESATSAYTLLLPAADACAVRVPFIAGLRRAKQQNLLIFHAEYPTQRIPTATIRVSTQNVTSRKEHSALHRRKLSGMVFMKNRL